VKISDLFEAINEIINDIGNVEIESCSISLLEGDKEIVIEPRKDRIQGDETLH